MNKIENVNVTPFTTVFRNSLLALIPWLDKGGVLWKGADSYDAWDNIVTALYEGIVGDSIRWNKGFLIDYNLAKYGFYYENYSGIDYIKVISPTVDDNLAFISFETVKSPFDSVNVAVLSTNDVVDQRTIEFEGLDFVFVSNKDQKNHVKPKPFH